MAEGMNISMCYIEKADSNIISGFCMNTILKFAHSVFFQLCDHNKHPKVLGISGINILHIFYQEMEHQFLELTLCADHWKVQYLVTKKYSSWYTTHGKAPTVKLKADSNSGDTGIDPLAKSHRKHCTNEDSI